MPVAASEPIGLAPRPRGASRLAELTAALRDFGHRRRTPITVVGSLATAALLAFLLGGRRDEFATALSGAAAWVLAATVLLQIVALLARSEAWHLTIREAGGTVDRRVLYRASSMGVLGGLLNAQLAVAARIAALRRSSPDVSPQVPTLVAAEFPILAVEAALAGRGDGGGRRSDGREARGSGPVGGPPPPGAVGAPRHPWGRAGAWCARPWSHARRKRWSTGCLGGGACRSAGRGRLASACAWPRWASRGAHHGP